MFLKTNDKLFEQIFKSHIANTVQAARELSQLMDNLEDAERRVLKIVEFEHRGDQLAKEAHELFDRTFITKLDKPDIILLLEKLDHIMDFIKATATRVLVYQLKKGSSEAKQFAQIICLMTEILDSIFSDFSNIRIVTARQQALIIKGLEEDADHLLYKSLKQLFANENDPKLLIAWKDVYENLERITDQCEDVMNIINSIARKESK